MKSLIVLIFSFPSLVTVFCAHCREKEVFERVCSFPCHNWTRLALIFMMFWWYGRPAMRLIGCITGIHSSFGWLTHNVGEFYAPSSGHRIHSDGIYFGNDRAVASRTHSSSWLKRSPSAPGGPHDMFQKVHPICRLMKGPRLQSPLQTRVVNTWQTKDVGPGLCCEAQTLQRSPFLRWAPLWALAGLHSGDTTEWWDFHLTDVKLSRSLATSDWMIFTPPRRLWHPVLVIRRQSVRAEPCAVQCLVGDERQNEN